jgi:hypothetical protein
LGVLVNRLRWYNLSRDCQPRANAADFETLKTLVGFMKAWMASNGGFDAKTG